MTEGTEPDWDRERSELKQFILHRLRRRFRHAIDDREIEFCVQDALVKLFRWWRLEREAGRPIGSLGAMKNRIANFAAIDLVREQVRQRRFVPIGAGRTQDPEPGDEFDRENESVPAGSHFVDAPERLRYLLLAHFESASAPCLELARHFFAGRSWQDVAAEMRLTADTVKQRWSRCVKAFRQMLAENPECEEWVFEESP